MNLHGNRQINHPTNQLCSHLANLHLNHLVNLQEFQLTSRRHSQRGNQQ
jgi:hypothetical protein